MKTTCKTNSVVHLVSNPSIELLKIYWQARQADPLVPAFYADTGPRTFEAFVQTIETGGYIYRLAIRNEQIVGAIWLHDIERGTDGQINDAWIGGYVLPGMRGGNLLRKMWDIFRPECEQMDIWHIHGGTRSDNKVGYRAGCSELDLIHIGVFPKFTTFDGVCHDCIIFTLHPEDKERAWKIAYKRWLKGQKISAT